jgi:hypothetical protein
VVKDIKKLLTTPIVWCRGCLIKAKKSQKRKNLDMKNEDSKIEQPCAIQNVSVRYYSEQDLIKAAKYGYEYRDTTSFPELSFEGNCENNTKQWIVGVLNAR